MKEPHPKTPQHGDVIVAEVPAIVFGPAGGSAAAADAPSPATVGGSSTRRSRKTAAASNRQTLPDLVCLRHLDRRRCAAADAARDLRRCAEVVVVEIPAPKKAAVAVAAPAASTADDEPQPPPSPAPAAARHLLSALQAAGLAVAHDACRRGVTPGSRFFAWEAAGVPIRAEVGPREAAAGCVTLAIHPALVSDPLLRRLRGRPVLAPLAAGDTGGGAAAGQALRLAGVAMADAPAACLAILAAAAAAACLTGRSAAAAAAAGDASDNDAEVEQAEGAQQHRPLLLPGGVCPRLHLWPAAAPPPCPVHLRHLLRMGHPCHCRVRRHVSMQQLAAEVEAALQRQRGQRVVAWEHAEEPPLLPLTTLFVSRLPVEKSVSALRQRLSAAFEQYGLLRGGGICLFCGFGCCGVEGFCLTSC